VSNTQAVAGWYPDPENPEQECRWDGQRWTEQRRSLPNADAVKRSRMKLCPSCSSSLTNNARKCPDCGYVFEPRGERAVPRGERAVPRGERAVVQASATVPGKPQELLARYYGTFADWFGAAGWKPLAPTSTGITYTKRRFKTWQIVVSIIFFPLGCLALLADREVYSVTATFADAGEGKTTITMAGTVPPRLAEHVPNVLNELGSVSAYEASLAAA